MPALNPIGTPFIELLTVESTNNYAMGLVRAGMAQHGSTVFTHDQTRGKGQRNKEWTSQRNQNIALSVVIQPNEIYSSQPFLLSMLAAVSVHELFINYVKNKVRIKWPNDIYWCDRKAAGILIENIWQGEDWKFAVIGIGVNVNQTDFGDLETKAVSLTQITGKQFEPLKLSKEMATIMENNYQELLSDHLTIVKRYKSNLYKLYEYVTLKTNDCVFEAEFKDVNDQGQMVVQHSVEEKFNVGEVEWLIKGV